MVDYDRWDCLALGPDDDPWEVVARELPAESEHDYVLWTDGSGCTAGWGASTAVWLDAATGKHDMRVNATYGQTVGRSEFQALLDGLQGILSDSMRTRKQLGLRGLPTAKERLTVMWHTDRKDLALAMLFDEQDRPLGSRAKMQDLWARYHWLSRCFCVTPVWAERNTVYQQGLCDTLCGVARNQLKNAGRMMIKLASEKIKLRKWKNNKRPQDEKF